MSLKRDLKNWYSKPNTRNKHVVRVKVSNDGTSTGINCLLCLFPTSFLTSVKARVTLQYNKRVLLNPNSIGNPTEYITRKGNVLHVDTLKQVSYPDVRTGRVCDKCKHLLTLSEIQMEDSDRKVEVYSDHTNLGFGKSDGKGY